MVDLSSLTCRSLSSGEQTVDASLVTGLFKGVLCMTQSYAKVASEERVVPKCSEINRVEARLVIT